MWPGTWWLPGGGINFGESPTQCLVREFREETGLLVTPHTLTTVVSDITDLPDRSERIHSIRLLYTVDVRSGTVSSVGDDTTDDVVWHALADSAYLPLMPFVRDMLSAPLQGVPRGSAISSRHRDDTTLGAERPHLAVWRARGW